MWMRSYIFKYLNQFKNISSYNNSYNPMVFFKHSGTTAFIQRESISNVIEARSLQGAYYVCQGKPISCFQNIDQLATIEVFLPLLGGKGGFGAKLKTEGGKKVRPNDNMYSRDIQGRPIAYAALEKQYKEYYEKKLVEDEMVKKELAQYKVMENTLKEEHAFNKLDRTYHIKMQATEERISDAVKTGLSSYLAKKGENVTERVTKDDKEEVVQDQKDRKQIENEGEEEKQLCEVKRQRPQPLDEEPPKAPEKRVKPNEVSDWKEKSQLSQKPKLLSAKDKLKSLFKK